MIFTVYILYSKKYNKIYIGFTSNLIERYRSHNYLSTKGWTVRFRPWVVIFSEVHLEKKAAIKRELQLKSGKGREWIWKQIHEKLESTGFISAEADGSSSLLLGTL
jgi:putative endonuclease